MSIRTIAAADIRVEVEPERGGRVGQITVGSTELLVGRSETHHEAIAWGAYPMVPWAGRIRHGRFEFRGRTVQVPIDHGDHAMHGVGHRLAWHVIDDPTGDPTDDGADRVRLGLELPADERWPFGGRVTQTFAVDPAGVTFEMQVTADSAAFPVAIGWHPWFRKPARIDVPAEAMYRRDDEGIAVDELVAVPPPPWDDCFIVREPIALTVADVDLVLRSTTEHWVVYDGQAHATCVEPQTGPPDAFNIAPRILEPGDTAAVELRIDIEPHTHVT